MSEGTSDASFPVRSFWQQAPRLSPARRLPKRNPFRGNTAKRKPSLMASAGCTALHLFSRKKCTCTRSSSLPFFNEPFHRLGFRNASDSHLVAAGSRAGNFNIAQIQELLD